MFSFLKSSISPPFLIIIGIIVFLVIVTGWFLFIYTDFQFFPQEKTEGTKVEVKEEIDITIDYGEGLVRVFQSQFSEGMTAFDLLKNKTEEFNLVLKTKTYDTGIFIEAIGEKENGQDGNYWMYYVNDEMPPVSADKKEIKAGDKLEFKFEKSNW